MSRSYKKTPVVKQSTKRMKSIANRKVRRSNLIIANGSAYRKVFCSYDISDYSLRETYEEYRSWAESCEKTNLNCRGFQFDKDYIDGMSYWNWYRTYKGK